MIIVSQDKKAIHNFKQISSLQVERKNKENSIYQIVIYDSINDGTSLGEYESEDRAIEVLKEIGNKFMEYAELKNGAGGIVNVFNIPKAYIMPIK